MPYINKKNVRKYQDTGIVPSGKWDINREDYPFFDWEQYDKWTRKTTESPVSGRQFGWDRRFVTPESSMFTLPTKDIGKDVTQGDTQGDPFSHLFGGTKGEEFTTFNVGSDITGYLHSLSEDQLKQILDMRGGYTFAPRKPIQGQLPKGATKADRRYLSPVDKDKFTYGSKYGHLSDMNKLEEILGKKINSNFADILMKQIGGGQIIESLTGKYPGLDPGSEGKHWRQRGGDRFDTEMSGQFVNAPLDYQENYYASFGQDAKKYPGEEWMNVQRVYSDMLGPDATVGDMGFGEKAIISALGEDSSIYDRYNNKRMDTRGIGSIGGEDSEQLLGFGVSWNEDKGMFYSKGRNRYLSDGEAKVYKQLIAGDYLNKSGFKEATPEKAITTERRDVTSVTEDKGVEGLPPQQQKVVPSEKTEVTPSFIDDESEGEPGVITDAKKQTGLNQSIDAVVQSWKDRTHIQTGENYGSGDLERDSSIIKEKYGKDAYDKLVGDLNSIVEEPKSETPAVKEEEKLFTINKDDDDDDDGVEEETVTVEEGGDDEGDMTRGTYGWQQENQPWMTWRTDPYSTPEGSSSVVTWAKGGKMFQVSDWGKKRELRNKINEFEKTMDQEDENDVATLALLKKELEKISSPKSNPMGGTLFN